MARDEDAAAEAAEEAAYLREELAGHRCRCGGDMPGSCPGVDQCPMCQPDAEDEGDE